MVKNCFEKGSTEQLRQYVMIWVASNESQRKKRSPRRGCESARSCGRDRELRCTKSGLRSPESTTAASKRATPAPAVPRRAHEKFKEGTKKDRRRGRPGLDYNANFKKRLVSCLSGQSNCLKRMKGMSTDKSAICRLSDPIEQKCS